MNIIKNLNLNLNILYLIATVSLLFLLMLSYPIAHAENKAPDPEVKIVQVTQSLITMRLKKGVSIEDSINAMTSKASALNLKLVGRQQVSKELNSRGIKTPHLEVLQYCDPVDAAKIVAQNITYAAYIPCQITLAEDNQGNAWLLMRNMDMMIDNEMVSADLAEIAIRINQAMLIVLTAGATGDF